MFEWSQIWFKMSNRIDKDRSTKHMLLKKESSTKTPTFGYL